MFNILFNFFVGGYYGVFCIFAHIHTSNLTDYEDCYNALQYVTKHTEIVDFRYEYQVFEILDFLDSFIESPPQSIYYDYATETSRGSVTEVVFDIDKFVENFKNIKYTYDYNGNPRVNKIPLKESEKRMIIGILEFEINARKRYSYFLTGSFLFATIFHMAVLMC